MKALLYALRSFGREVRSGEVLVLLADPRFADVAELLPWAAPVSFFFLTYMVFSRVLISLDKNRWVGGLTVAGGVVNVALNLALIPGLGPAGAALATSLSLAFLTAVAGRLIGFFRCSLPPSPRRAKPPGSSRSEKPGN